MTESRENPYAPPIATAPPAERGRRDALPLASRSARLAAAVIDGLLLAVSFVPYIATVVALLDWRNPLVSARSLAMGPTRMLVLALAVVPPLGLLAFQWYLIAVSGQTLGKRWMGLRILKLDGAPVGFFRGVVLRNWVLRLATFVVAFVPYLGGSVWLLDLLLIFRDDHRCLHDHLAGTKVVLDGDG